MMFLATVISLSILVGVAVVFLDRRQELRDERLSRKLELLNDQITESNEIHNISEDYYRAFEALTALSESDVNE